jgi:hypothetical protein
MNETEPASSTGPARSRGARVKRWLISFAVGVLAGAVLFGIGWWQGRQEVSRLNQRITEMQTELGHARNRASIMEARASLYRAAIDLDQRNFGTANGHLRAAAHALGAVTDTTITGLRELGQAVAATDLTVAADLEAQRNQVIQYAQRLDGLTADTVMVVPMEGDSR